MAGASHAPTGRLDNSDQGLRDNHPLSDSSAPGSFPPPTLPYAPFRPRPRYTLRHYSSGKLWRAPVRYPINLNLNVTTSPKFEVTKFGVHGRTSNIDGSLSHHLP
ncbi:hypothetical protein BDP55DRAFT_629201 [Colletotrichum godetiae]|uniref:Uncharacterized protein n=1 Tax=Colletotrichum godetiae TaxID=1209918 RepID=A0AAJ0F166_9PEZI|nr:uncharacterized protein BDP55DRAFT_629201 [Colletotrichum godetiae]KAK1689233.1 hypothetical protein BDP55DRAFT_629201 [Colletotrichum godetiae]